MGYKGKVTARMLLLYTYSRPNAEFDPHSECGVKRNFSRVPASVCGGDPCWTEGHRAMSKPSNGVLGLSITNYEKVNGL